MTRGGGTTLRMIITIEIKRGKFYDIKRRS